MALLLSTALAFLVASPLLAAEPAGVTPTAPATTPTSPPAPAAGDVVTSPAPASQPGAGSAGGLISNSFLDTNLRQALSDVSLQAGVTVVMDDSVTGFVTLELKDVAFEKALDLMLMPGGFVWGQVQPGLYLVTAPDPKSPSFQQLAETRLVSLEYLTPEQLKSLLPDYLAKLVRFDPVRNRVVVEAPPKLADQIVARIAAADTAPRQVMIEAMVVETEAGALRDYDLSFGTSHLGGSISGGIIRYQSKPVTASGSDTDLAAPTPGNIVIGLKWLLSHNKAALRANPRIVALDGESAEIEVSKDQYFSIVTGSAVYAYTTLQLITAPITLQIKPRIAEQTQDVICDLEANVSDVVGTGTGGLPVITSRKAKSRLRLRDGEAIAIGGLMEEQETQSGRRVPVLSEIPLIGHLFRSRTTSQSRREIVILIAPHVLNADGTFEGQLLSQLLMDATKVTAPPSASHNTDTGPGKAQTTADDALHRFDFGSPAARTGK